MKVRDNPDFQYEITPSASGDALIVMVSRISTGDTRTAQVSTTGVEYYPMPRAYEALDTLLGEMGYFSINDIPDDVLNGYRKEIAFTHYGRRVQGATFRFGLKHLPSGIEVTSTVEKMTLSLQDELRTLLIVRLWEAGIRPTPVEPGRKRLGKPRRPTDNSESGADV